MPIKKQFGTDWTEAIHKVEPPNPTPDGKYAPKFPARIIICGPSSSGKTFALLSMLFGEDRDCHMIVDKIHICTKNFDEPAYKILTNAISKVEAGLQAYLVKTGQARRARDEAKVGYYYRDPMELMGMIDDMDDTTRKLFVFDDMELNQGGQAGKIIDEFYQRCRKKNATVVFIAQTYYGTNKFIRRNANYKFIFKPTGRREIDCLAGDIAMDANEFKEIAEKIWREPHGWVQILPNGEIRQGFYPLDMAAEDDSAESDEESGSSDE